MTGNGRCQKRYCGSWKKALHPAIRSGEKLYYCTSKNFEARQDHFVCSTSRLKGKEVCSTHFIRAVVLEQGVFAHMRMTIACVANHEEQFRKAMGAKQKADAKKELATKRRQLTQAERRIEELD